MCSGPIVDPSSEGTNITRIGRQNRTVKPEGRGISTAGLCRPSANVLPRFLLRVASFTCDFAESPVSCVRRLRENGGRRGRW